MIYCIYHPLTVSYFVSSRENLHLMEEGQGLPREELDERIAREEFRRPRESLLNICTEFYKHCGPRLKILQNLAGEPRVTSLELLDVKSHMRYSTGILFFLFISGGLLYFSSFFFILADGITFWLCSCVFLSQTCRGCFGCSLDCTDDFLSFPLVSF